MRRSVRMRDRTGGIVRYDPAMTRERTRTWLDAARGSAGAWGYVPGAAASLEPTLLAVAAGAPLPSEWIAAQPPSWATLMLPACLYGRPEPAAGALRQTARATIDAWEPWLAPETPGDFDGALRGWSWTPGTFTWVEPTLWAVLSLRALGAAGAPRVDEGLRVLADRQGADGGWNAGNPSVLGAALPSYAYLTGLALLALPPGHPRVGPAVDFLRSGALRPSSLTLAAAVLGLARHELPVAGLAARLAERASPEGHYDGRVDRTALALMALDVSAGGRLPLGLDRGGSDGE